jgi:hypothetical protein
MPEPDDYEMMQLLKHVLSKHAEHTASFVDVASDLAKELIAREGVHAKPPCADRIRRVARSPMWEDVFECLGDGKVRLRADAD